MTEETPQGCVQPAGGPVMKAQADEPEGSDGRRDNSKELKMQVFVGKEAPDFTAGAYHEGGFKNITLSDYRGRWVFLCFYPGDFTFV